MDLDLPLCLNSNMPKPSKLRLEIEDMREDCELSLYVTNSLVKELCLSLGESHRSDADAQRLPMLGELVS